MTRESTYSQMAKALAKDATEKGKELMVGAATAVTTSKAGTSMPVDATSISRKARASSAPASGALGTSQTPRTLGLEELIRQADIIHHNTKIFNDLYAQVANNLKIIAFNENARKVVANEKFAKIRQELDAEKSKTIFLKEQIIKNKKQEMAPRLDLLSLTMPRPSILSLTMPRPSILQRAIKTLVVLIVPLQM